MKSEEVFRKCKKCGEIKLLEEFPTRSYGYYRHSCKICWRKYENSRYHAGYSSHYRDKYRNKTRKYVFEYLKNNPCIDCGEKEPCCLDFDHVKGTKYKTICKMVQGCYSIEKVHKEISKCEVRCANCHRKKTARDFKWYKDL